jgi:putative ABC transport system ATP-binding protein
LLADEPTAEVDAQTESQIFQLFEERRQLGGATIIATHSQALARLGDRIIFLQDGRITNDRNTGRS